MINVGGPSSGEMLQQLLAACLQRGASDLHLTPSMHPTIRVDGELVGLEQFGLLAASQTENLAQVLLDGRLGDGRSLIDLLKASGAIDGALTDSAGTRFRYNVFRRQNQIAIVLRRLEDRFRTLSELGLPESLHALSDLRDGLVVVSGPTGSGKSTTLATLLDRINSSRRCHLVTIEDPIEYIHKPILSVVNQRQIGIDAPTFNHALVSSLRQDPDVILVGEIRDLETIRTAITAAETGHLVFTTLHAGDCVSSVERLVSVFPADEQDGIRRQLSLVLRAVIAQHLLPCSGTNGTANSRRVAASETLMINSAIANLIATGKSAQIYSTMEAGQAHGMQTLEQDLARLWVSGLIGEEVAMATSRKGAVVRDRAELLRKRRGVAIVGGGMR